MAVSKRSAAYLFLSLVIPLVFIVSSGCGGEEAAPVATQAPVIQTVVVEKPVEKIVKETVVVEKSVVQTVVVEKAVVVEKPVVQTVIVEKKVVETVVAIATPTPTAVAAKPLAVPQGSLTAAISAISTGVMGWFPSCINCASTVHVGSHEALFEGGRDAQGGLLIVPWIVEKWATAPDLSYTDFTLRKGITFNQGFGEMTADDVAWTFNLTSTATNPDSTNDTGVQIPEFTGAEALDKYVVRFKWSGYAGHSLPMRYTDLQEGIGTWSKKAFEQKGKEWMKDNIIGTGPFELVEWTENNVIRLKARNEHWRKVPYVAAVKILAVPEATTRRAMLVTRTALAGGVALKDLADMVNKSGFQIAPETNTSAFAAVFGGNYWERTHFKTGATLTRTRDISKPWIGDPYELGNEFNRNTPSMEKSRKVRQALALAIDRKTIVAKIMGGIGEPHYLGSIWMDDPIFKKNSAEWTIPYDPAKARQLMKEAGYEKGFKIQIYTGPDAFGIGLLEAVGNYWATDLNVTPEFDRADYTVFRPTIVARTNKQYFAACCYGPAMWPNEWTLNSANSPGNYNVLEFPLAATTEKIKNTSKTTQEIEKAAYDILKYLYDEWLWPGIVQYPGAAIYDPKLMEWEHMRPFQWMRIDGLRSFEYIKLK